MGQRAGDAFWVKYHFKTDQGIGCLDIREAAELAGLNPDSHQLDLVEAIDRGRVPVVDAEGADHARGRGGRLPVQPVRPDQGVATRRTIRCIEVGRLALDRNPDNYFADVEQAGFDPGNFVPGIGPSPDKMLQGRLFAYGDAHRYRLGINHTQLPVNAPHATEAHNYGRDGVMAGQGNGGRAKNYEPNSFGGPVETNRPLYVGRCDLSGAAGTYEWDATGHRRLRAGRRPLPVAAARRAGAAGRQHRRRVGAGVVRSRR